MDWTEHYQRNLVSADEAVQLVRSGDTVAVAESYPEPEILLGALAARRRELENVRIMGINPMHDPGWYQPGWSDSFNVVLQNYLGEVARPAYDAGLIDYYPAIYSQEFKHYHDQRDPGQKLDVNMAVVSPPDEHGFCSFGEGVWDKRRMAQTANVVLAQIDESFIRTYGTNYLHVSEIDRFVEYPTMDLTREECRLLIDQVQSADARGYLGQISESMSDGMRHRYLPQLCQAGTKEIIGFAQALGLTEPPEEAVRMAAYVAELIPDGATLQIGAGTPTGYLPRLGAFDDKKDLGWHSEMWARGAVKLVERGVINGSRKTLNPGITVSTSLSGSSAEEIEYAADNPLFELREVDYVANISTASAHDMYHSMNNALAVDFSGQITCETVGARLYNGTGGQVELHMGGVLSRGGRAMTLMWSTAANGTVSRITPHLPEGAAVTIPRTFADTVITEYGVAQLLGKSIRERARELIAIAHPDFRKDLQKAADALYYP